MKTLRYILAALALATIGTGCKIPNGNGCTFMVAEHWAGMDYQRPLAGGPGQWVSQGGRGPIVGYSWEEDAATDRSAHTNVWTTKNCTYSNGKSNNRPQPGAPK